MQIDRLYYLSIVVDSYDVITYHKYAAWSLGSSYLEFTLFRTSGEQKNYVKSYMPSCMKYNDP